EKTTFTEAFSMADDVLYQGVKGVTDLMVRPGLINLDFADVRAVMDEMGKAMMGTGEADGEDRAVQAAEKAIANPLLDEISLRGAKGVLINITGGYDLTLFELDEAANRIREEVDPDANIIVGSTLDPEMEHKMRVSVVATGIDASVVAQDAPVQRRRLSEPLQPDVSVDDAVSAPAAKEAPEPEEVFLTEMEEAEPSLFGVFDPAASTAQEQQREDIFAGDEVPSPVYRPQQPQPAAARHDDEDVARFVAPKPLAPGTPTPEAMARLKAAVNKAPATAVSRPSDPHPSVSGEKPRFGINSLINRMTGQAGEGGGREAPAVRQRPRPQVHPEEQEMTADQEKIEIPAFLRRQAN
ncbi:MAG: cell division protein FtsZ, partial [Pseudomonadota bacterium]